jgi:hypothetical protein
LKGGQRRKQTRELVEEWTGCRQGTYAFANDPEGFSTKRMAL